MSIEQLITHNADKERTGTIDAPVLKNLMSIGFSLTRLQLSTLVGGAPLDESGKILWQQYLPRLAMMVKAMIDPHSIAERAEMAERAEFMPLQIMGGREQQAVENMLREVGLACVLLPLPKSVRLLCCRA